MCQHCDCNLQAAKGNIDEALAFVHKFPGVLLQPVSRTDLQPCGNTLLAGTAAEGHRPVEQLLGSQPGLSAAVPQPAVDLERQLPAPAASSGQNKHSSHNRTPASACKPAVNGDAFDARTPQAVQTSADSRLAPVGLHPAATKQLLPAGVSSSTGLTHSQHEIPTSGQQVSPDKCRDALEPSPDSSSSPGNRRLTFCSTGSDESTEMHEHVPWQSTHDSVPESVDAAMAAASKVLEERGKIRGMADQERQTLTLHTQARDVYFEAAQKAYERGMCSVRLTQRRKHMNWVCVV